jgi:hypothetical protein
MFFFWFALSRPRYRKVREGYFYCPKCQLRAPCQRICVDRGWYLFGLIPVLYSRSSATLLRCGFCHDDYPEANGRAYDFSKDPMPGTWKCFACGKETTNLSFHCKHCGAHV